MSDELSAVREVWADRTRARTRGDALYLLYVAVLSVLVFGIPALRSAGAALARPDVLPVLLLEGAPQLASAAVLAAGAAAVLLGAVRGPALLSPFLTASLASSGIRRRAVLWRPFARSLAVPALALAVLAALLAVTLVSDGRTSSAAAAWFVLAAVGSGLLLGAAWMAGELLEARARRLLALALLAAAVLAALLPEGVGLGGSYPVGAIAPGLWAAVLLTTGAGAALAGVLLLDRLRGRVLREQAARWESATTIATTGDMAGASGTFRPPPSAGRALSTIGPRPLLLLYVRRDAVAWLRSPERLAVGVVTALLAAAVLGGSTLLDGPLGWAAVLLGAGALWGASGTLVDGLRHGVHTLGAPALFGQSAAMQVVLHTVAPMVLLTGLAALGGGVVRGTAGAGEPAALAALLLPTLLAPVLVIARARDAAKGPMPLALVTPMPTAQGDMAVLPMLAWQSDALLLALLSGVVLAGLVLLGPAGMMGGSAVLTAVMAMMTGVRLRALRR